MRKPEQVLCDFCHNEIRGGTAVLSYPLTPAQREALIPQIAIPPVGILGLLQPMDLVPVAVTLEACRDCLDGVMPVIREHATRRIEAVIRERAVRMSVIGREGA